MRRLLKPGLTGFSKRFYRVRFIKPVLVCWHDVKKLDEYITRWFKNCLNTFMSSMIKR